MCQRARPPRLRSRLRTMRGPSAEAEVVSAADSIASSTLVLIVALELARSRPEFSLGAFTAENNDLYWAGLLVCEVAPPAALQLVLEPTALHAKKKVSHSLRMNQPASAALDERAEPTDPESARPRSRSALSIGHPAEHPPRAAGHPRGLPPARPRAGIASHCHRIDVLTCVRCPALS